MTILGIDPGYARLGYGVISGERNAPKLVAAGILPISKGTPSEILKEIKSGMDRLFDDYRPDRCAIEKLYFAKNQTTGLRVAEARGVILLAAAERNIPIREYAPNEVKSYIAGYGLADKKSVLKMVRLILREPELHVIDDASDALALALVEGGRSTIHRKS